MLSEVIKKISANVSFRVFKYQGIDQSTRPEVKCFNFIHLTGNLDENTRQKCLIWPCTAYVKTVVAQNKYQMFVHILMEWYTGMKAYCMSSSI